MRPSMSWITAMVGKSVACDVVVPVGPVGHLAARRLGGADHADARQPDDRLRLGVDADHRLHRVAEARGAPGLVISSPLQMVGVSHWASTSRSAWVNGRSAIASSCRPVGACCAAMQVIAKGGKALYGAPLGILMLEAKFPRIPGDMGNATTWPFPVLYRVVRGATPERVVLNAARRPAGRTSCAAAAELVARRRRGDHHQLRLPVAVPGGTRGACAACRSPPAR